MAGASERSPGFLLPGMCDDFTPQLTTAELKKRAEQHLASLLEEGVELHPVINTTRKLASNFWGSAWMKQLAYCESGGMSLAPGRSLLRHGCVLDLHISTCCIQARVSSQDLYEVQLKLHPLNPERLEQLATTCGRHIESLLSLLEGKINTSILQHLCHPESGLLPAPTDWQMSCTCPDWAEPCPHAAAAIYAAGCLIDTSPDLLFTLRGISPAELLQPTKTEELDSNALSTQFGIDLELPGLQ